MTDDTVPSNRVARRDSLLLLAEMHAEDSGRPIGTARIRNLSATGLMAEYDGLLQDGARVFFALRGNGEVKAHVSWCRDGRIGLTFDAPIDPKAARRAVGATGVQPTEAYRSIGVAPVASRFSRTPR